MTFKTHVWKALEGKVINNIPMSLYENKLFCELMFEASRCRNCKDFNNMGICHFGKIKLMIENV